LIFAMDTTGRNDRDGTLRQLAVERCERNALSGNGHK